MIEQQMCFSINSLICKTQETQETQEIIFDSGTLLSLELNFSHCRSPWLPACLYARLWGHNGPPPRRAFVTRHKNWQHCIVTNLYRQLNNEQSSQIHDDCSIRTYLMYQKSMVIIDWRENQNSGGSL